ncbi:tripartite tricarboxylate transporter TctB family protein [Fluviibacterium sp. DFM31]|uniref:Tripartite tricarboxylate transporter TctB family protein n=1 Tax=Meridianimarinicoccus marinus TaxID=3231483 RepID=A0ABV3LEK6_9RHOB
MMDSRKKADLLCGAAVALLGVVALSSATGWEVGSLRRIGPAVFPGLVGAVLVGLGIAIALVDDRIADEEAPAPVNLRGLLLVVAGLAAFTMLIKSAGLIPAIWAAVFLSAYADPAFRLRDTALVALIMSGIGLGLFVHLLGFQARAFGAY